MKEPIQVKIDGHVIIRDVVTCEVVFDETNAIHPQNMALVIARALSRDPNGYIFNLVFGNGGTFLNSSNQIVFRPPNTVGASTLYNQTYSVQVDDQSAGTPNTNSVISSQSTARAITSIITVTAELNASEPNGQASADNVTTNPNSTFTFDELGLTTNDSPPLLLSHLIFSPFEKTANRAFQVIYTLTVSVS